MKYALITGAYSELAHVLIDTLKDDCYLFLIDRNPNLLSRYKDYTNVTPILCDLTNIDEIKSVYETVSEVTQKLDLIYHFAGLIELGSLIEVPFDKLKRMFEVNIFAIYQLNQLFFPLLKEAKGRIIHIGSEYGKLLALPFHSFYTMTKHTLEVYNDSLRRELAPSGIKVIIIRPGAFKTDMQGRITDTFNRLVLNTTYYKKPLLKMQKMMDSELARAKDPIKIKKTLLKATYKKHPKRAYNIKNSFKMKVFSSLSKPLQDLILKAFFG